MFRTAGGILYYDAKVYPAQFEDGALSDPAELGDACLATRDLTNNSRNGTASAGTGPLWDIVSGQETWTFDGVDDNFAIGSGPTLAGGFTVWFVGNITSTAADRFILGGTGSNYLSAYVLATTNLFRIQKRGATNIYATTGAITTGSRIVLGFAYNYSDDRAWVQVNGTNQTLGAVSHPASDVSAATTFVGIRDTSLQPFSGSMNALVIYNRFLSDSTDAGAVAFVTNYLRRRFNTS